MDEKLSRKRLWEALAIITLVYIILQGFLLVYGDWTLSRRFWIEQSDHRALEDSGKPESSEFTPRLKVLSDHHFWILRAAVMGSFFLALYYRERDKRRYTLFRSIFISALLILILVSGVITWILKLSIGRPRPYSGLTEWRPLSLSTKYHSFPSGHTTETFSYIIPYMYFLRRHLVTLMLFLYGVVLSFTRVMLAYHSITDVLFGIYITAVFGMVICSCVEGRYGSR
jgi:membrane-associated phospholipid phosphatase